MPIITSVICYSSGLGWVDLIGEISNGIIQIYLGYLICKENVEILSGRSISKKDKQSIIHIMENREEVSEIADVKTEYIGTESMKISATVKYDSREIAKNIIEILEPDIQKITNDAKKREDVRNLLIKSTDLLLTHTTEIIRNMEEDVQRAFPNATEIDLELAKSNIKTEYEGVVSLTTSSSDDEHHGTGIKIQYENK